MFLCSFHQFRLSSFINLSILFFPLPFLLNPALGLPLCNQRLLIALSDEKTHSLGLPSSSSSSPCLCSGKGAEQRYIPHWHGWCHLTLTPSSTAPSNPRYLQNTPAATANWGFAAYALYTHTLCCNLYWLSLLLLITGMGQSWRCWLREKGPKRPGRNKDHRLPGLTCSCWSQSLPTVGVWTQAGLILNFGQLLNLFSGQRYSRVLNRVVHSLGSLGSWPPLHFFLPQNKLSKQIPHRYWEINTKRLPYLFWLRTAPCFPSTSRVSYFRSPSLAWTSTVSKWSTCLPPLLYPACPLHCYCWASWSQMQLSHPFLCVLVKKNTIFVDFIFNNRGSTCSLWKYRQYIFRQKKSESFWPCSKHYLEVATADSLFCIFPYTFPCMHKHVHRHKYMHIHMYVYMHTSVHPFCNLIFSFKNIWRDLSTSTHIHLHFVFRSCEIFHLFYGFTDIYLTNPLLMYI